MATNSPDVKPEEPSSFEGLKSSEILELRKQYGYNTLPEAPIPSISILFLRQFLSPFIYILLIAAVISLLLGQLPSAVFIVLVLIINAIIGVSQEYSAQKSAKALQCMVRGMAHVVRDGITQAISIEDLLPGDLVLLSSGDKVPADLKIISAQDLRVDESMLTGESVPVKKDSEDTLSNTPLTTRSDKCFAGTIVTHGRAKAVVISTGLDTEIGHISKSINKERSSEPPLMIRIRKFTYQVAGGILLAILLLIILMVFKGGYEFEAIVLMSLGLAVSTIPEGLPAALTVALAIGMYRMAEHSVIIRKLVAVEALGSCTFICSDKTGTLTVNELTIKKVVLPDGKIYKIGGEGVAPGGEINSEYDTELLRDLCITGALANESHLDYAGGQWVSDGDIVDVAFLVLAKKLGLSLSTLKKERVQAELIPYESERAFSGSLNCSAEGYQLYVKGSPEKMLEHCSHMWVEGKEEPILVEKIQKQFEELARQGYRVIALAKRKASNQDAESQLCSMTFLGMVAMTDPVRPEAFEAVEKCKRGGVDVAMVTGDHPATAKAIALELKLCTTSSEVLTGAMLRDAASLEDADEMIRRSRVFARIEPQQKEQIVESFIRAGHFVAVTGDGVNDAPAMRAANAGIAMGENGTDVARESADLIITDDNFASIVNGIEQGRIVYGNIRKVIALLIATGFSAILLFFLTVLAGLPMPLLAVQLLWLNLIANGVQDVALAFEPREGGELSKPPRRPEEAIFEKHIVEHVLLTGTVMGGMAFLVFWWSLSHGCSLEVSRNITLMLMVLFGNIHALCSRSETRSLFKIKFFSNPFLILAIPLSQIIHISAMYLPGISNVLELHPVSLWQWVILFGISLSLFAVEELHKLWRRKK